MSIHNKLIIIGSGPAGLTASIYAARGGIEPLVISGNEPGGQLMYTSEVENFPGFDEPILGPILMEKMRKQAQRFGTRFVDKAISSVDFSSKPFRIRCSNSDNNNNNIEEYFADSVIIATGASAVWLGLESEQRLRGGGVSSCATCDGFFFKGKDVVVVGGGDTAMEEALFLIKFTKSVMVIHRRNKLNASAIMQQKAFRNEKISFLWNTIIEDILGNSKVESVRVKNVITGESKDIRTDGVFVAIGHKPNTELFKGQIELDERGYIKKYEESKTSIDGVFVAGDVYDYKYRQAITAAGSGCKAALDVINYLESKPKNEESLE
ncbi:MAG TPA: thioredoxin-disulfide reductase [Nitrososphaeraceae archaeon]|nr:thioredoxin-disulfide reductase [Nitrososphaeraceae archaeon]